MGYQVDIVYQKFCVLCGNIRSINRSGYRPKKIMLLENGETSDLGYACDKCLKHLENGGIFTKPRK